MNFFVTLLFFIFCLLKNLPAQNKNLTEVHFSETFEWAGIILTLTDYGKADEWEVQKRTSYYSRVMNFFESFLNHPLLKEVNYACDKWENYLSFRTDAYAFEITPSGKIKRKFPFFTNTGHNPFDDHLTLVQDFYEKTGFHSFYESGLLHYTEISKRYSDHYMLKEVTAFLLQESQSSENKRKKTVVLSPLVNRMNCHRQINDSVDADFPNLSLFLIESKPTDTVNQEQKTPDIHTIFTEMDHGYINPVTGKYILELTEFYN